MGDLDSVCLSGHRKGAGVAGDGARQQGKVGKTLGPCDSTPEPLSARTDQRSRVSQSPSDTPTHLALTRSGSQRPQHTGILAGMVGRKKTDSRTSEGHVASPKGLTEPNLWSLGYAQGHRLMERDAQEGCRGLPRGCLLVVGTRVFAS